MHHAIFFLKFVLLVTFVTCNYAMAKDNKIEKSTQLKTVTLLLDWKPNTNHLGFYVAQTRGFYAQYGIKLKILNPTQTTSTVLVGMHKADFGLSYTNNLIYARNANIPIKAIAGVVHTDSSCFVWRKSLNIKSLKDLEGKRYGGWGSPEENATLKFIMNKNGADFSKIKMLTTGTQDFLPATLKNVDFTWEYKGWNILAAQLSKVDVEMYCPAEHFAEFNKPSPLLITSEKMLNENKELVANFMQATKLGFQYAIAEPELAAKEMLKLTPELDKALVIASAKFLAPLYQEKNKQWGELDAKKFAAYTKWMKQEKLIDVIPDPSSYLTNEYVSK